MRFSGLAALRAAAFVALSASLASITPAAAAEKKANWTATVTVQPDGTHVLGNPKAKVKLDEFVSYTCSHCANFEKQADATLRLAYVQPGKLSVRVVHLVRDPVDMTVAMLTNCGDPAGFFKRHSIFLHAQDKWLPQMRNATEAQRTRWTSGDTAARFRAIAGDLGFYALMAPRGYTRTAVDRCLADDAMSQRIAAQSAAARELGVPGTPSFAIGGALLDSVHDWPALEGAIKERL